MIFDRHFAAVHAFLQRRVGRDVADDCAAEVFRIALSHRDRFDASAETARPWLFGIATNVVAKHRRRERRHLAALARLAGQAQPADDEFAQSRERVSAQVEGRRVLRCIAGLQDRDRDALLLVAWEGLSYQQAADALGVPVGTIRSRINRARRTLSALTASPESGAAVPISEGDDRR
ncbi:MAG: RNA polymerase sigma factor [Thermoleophilia bacterium]